MHAIVVVGNSEKSLVDGGVHEKKVRQIFHNMINNRHMTNCSLQFRSHLNFRIYSAKIHICDNFNIALQHLNSMIFHWQMKRNHLVKTI